ncbi:MAG: DNA topoisomerase IV subunit A [Metamycoplasmataceae bacterium]
MAKENNKLVLEDKNIEFKSLDYIMSERFSRYAKYIILQRALPDVRDGLKPVQRRILYSMYDLNLNYNKSFKKSARVVGDVIGKYHPHGDSSIYEALVRMAQDWKMNMPLVEMHGNKGSIDDDPAAAMRYTETRLSKISEEMLMELDKKIVPFSPNFDDSEKEPTVLPAYIPNLLLNGARGIAAGFATEIPPHNLIEIIDATIAKIKNPELSLNNLAKYIKGPDFPTGGIVYGKKGIEESFERGIGRISISSKYEIIQKPKEHKIIISEIPYSVIKSKLVKQIDDLRINSILAGISDVRDESDRNGISICIYLEQNANAEGILSFLFKKTDLQIFYSYNMVAIHENAPKTLGVSKMIDCYINFIKKLKVKSIQYDLNRAKNRLEIVDGFIRVAQIIDEVIRVIRKSEESKSGVIRDLIQQLNFSEIQAKAIAEMRLYRLNKTDVSFYLQEKEKLEKEIQNWNLLLNNEKEFDNFLISLLKNIKKEYGIERKTIIMDEELNLNIKLEEIIENETIYLSLTQDGYLKRISKRTYDSNVITTFGLKENDKIIYFSQSEIVNKLIVFSNKGNYILIPIHKITESKWKDFGVHISDFASFGKDEIIINAFDVNDFSTKAFVISLTKLGMGKKTLIEHFETSRISKPLTYMKLKSNKDEVIGVKLSNGLEDILVVSSNHYAIKFSENNVPNIALKSSGNIMMKLKNNYVSSFVIANNNDHIVFLNSKNKIKQLPFKILAYSNKANMGHQLFVNETNKDIIVDIESTQNLSLFYKNRENILFLEKYIFDKKNDPLEKSFENIKKALIWVKFLTFKEIKPNDYFNKKISQLEEKQLVDESIQKIDETFKKIDEKKIDDILKKFNI